MPTSASERSAIRFGLGVGVSFFLALFLAWPYAYLSAIISCVLLSARKVISFKQSLVISAMVVVMVLLVYGLFSLASPYPVVFVILLFISCYSVLYKATTGTPAILTLTALFCVLMIPTAYQVDASIAWSLVKWLPVNVLVGFLVASCMSVLMPLTKEELMADNLVRLAPEHAHKRAVLLAIVILPVPLMFWLFQLSDILVLVFLTLLLHALVESHAIRYRVTLGYLAANIIGGLVAIICFELLIMAPGAVFLLLLLCSVLLLIASKGFSKPALTPLLPSVCNAFIGLMGSATLYNWFDSQIAYLDRLAQIAVVISYLLVAFAVYESFRAGRQ